jgi:hypothetical protein
MGQVGLGAVGKHATVIWILEIRKCGRGNSIDILECSKLQK